MKLCFCFFHKVSVNFLLMIAPLYCKESIITLSPCPERSSTAQKTLHAAFSQNLTQLAHFFKDSGFNGRSISRLCSKSPPNTIFSSTSSWSNGLVRSVSTSSQVSHNTWSPIAPFFVFQSNPTEAAKETMSHAKFEKKVVPSHSFDLAKNIKAFSLSSGVGTETGVGIKQITKRLQSTLCDFFHVLTRRSARWCSSTHPKCQLV